MSVARIANRLPRYRRPNPGTEHIAGRDVTAKMQRQYEDILSSLRHYHRYSSDAKRKQVAAATVRKLAQNPDERQAAERLAEEFHGRAARGDIDVEQWEAYSEDGAVLGYLLELVILCEDSLNGTPISFDWDETRPEANILVVSNAAGTNIEFIGGNQNFKWWQVEGASRDTGKHLALIGPLGEITYFADKHHLGYPKHEADGNEYYHEFGKDPTGDVPWLVFDTLNSEMWLVGGDYKIKPEGITG
jgi:hypothetical protein